MNSNKQLQTQKKTTSVPPSHQNLRQMNRATHPASILQRTRVNPDSLTPADVLQLHRTIGNRAVGQLLSGINQASRMKIQAKLTINPPGDKYELEADRAAKQLVGQMNRPVSLHANPGQTAQRQELPEEEELLQTKLHDECIQCKAPEEEEELIQGKFAETIQKQGAEEEEEILQTKLSDKCIQCQNLPEEEELQMKPLVRQQPGGGMTATHQLEGAIRQARVSGQQLDSTLLAQMSDNMGYDFSGARVHTGPEADELNRQLNARAFTTGQDIFFRQGEYNPHTSTGQNLLVHELTHVVQQTGTSKRGSRKKPVQVGSGLPGNSISMKKVKMYLDFVEMKRKKAHKGRIFLEKLTLGGIKAPDDPYGHWWTETGDLVENVWMPQESYGWWPNQQVGLKKTLRGVPGVLNAPWAGGSPMKDPHHGQGSDVTFHPVMDVDDSERYEIVRNSVIGKIKSFAHGFSGKWNWRFGWGQNCHTFQKELMSEVGLHKGDAKKWLMRPDNVLPLSLIAKSKETAAKITTMEYFQYLGFETLHTVRDRWFRELVDNQIYPPILAKLTSEDRQKVLNFLDLDAEHFDQMVKLFQKWGE